MTTARQGLAGGEDQVARMSTWDVDLFVERYWNRAPVLVERFEVAPFTVQEAFDAAVRAATDGPVAVTLVHEGYRVPGGSPLLPRATDAGFDAYDERVRSDGSGYALIVAGLHSFSEALWVRERDFLLPLWRRTGLPSTGAITTLFHGPYAATPVGVHKDRFGTLMVPLRGRKQMRFWPTRPWTADVSSVQDYADLLEGSFVVEPRPGQALYWPAGFHHVGEGIDDRPATSVNIGFPTEEHQARYEVETLLADLTPAGLVNTGDILPEGLAAVTSPMTSPGPGPDGRAPDVPPALVESLRILASSCDERRVEHVSAEHWAGAGLLPRPAGTAT